MSRTAVDTWIKQHFGSSKQRKATCSLLQARSAAAEVAKKKAALAAKLLTVEQLTKKRVKELRYVHVPG